MRNEFIMFFYKKNILLILFFFLMLVLGASFLEKKTAFDSAEDKTSTGLHVYSSALHLFYSHNGFYPKTEQGLIFLAKDIEGFKAMEEGFVNYDSWGRPFVYREPSLCEYKKYDLYSLGENGLDECGRGDDIIDEDYEPLSF